MRKYVGIGISFAIWLVYLALQTKSIVGGDTGDLVSAAYTQGVAHPPGYPLYTLTGAILARAIPFYTVAFRVGLLSSIFAALSLFVFYRLLYFYTGRLILSALGTLILSFIYPFWLYATVAEVFSMAIFFLLLLYYLCIVFLKKPSFTLLCLLAFVLGLSLTHHHIVLFLLPTILYVLWKEKKDVRRFIKGRNVFLLLGLFILGLIPLVYLPVAASFYPPIDWEHPVTIDSFLRLFLRTTYGTFKAGSFVVDTPSGRFLSLASYFKLFLMDFRILGAILFMAGLIASVLRNRRRHFFILFIPFASFTFFLFYASFPLANDISLGTFERFAIFTYIFSIFYMVIGAEWFVLTTYLLMRKYLQISPKLSGVFIPAAFLILFIYPASIFVRNFPSILSIRDDFTAENLGRDILHTVSDDSMVVLFQDTPVFNTEYVYYTDGLYQKDIILLQLYKLFRPYYRQTLKVRYPEIEIPQSSFLSDESFILEFLSKNAKKHRVFTNFTVPSLERNLMPYGLLWEYKDKPSGSGVPEIKKKNDNLWQSYQTFREDKSSYKNLFQRDVLRVYSEAHQNYAFYLLNNNVFGEAEAHLKEAKKLTPADIDILYIEAFLAERQRMCSDAEKKYLEIANTHPDDFKPWEKLVVLSKECFSDKVREKKYNEKLWELTPLPFGQNK